MKESWKYLLKQLLGSSLEKVIYEWISIFIECAALLMQQGFFSVKLIIIFFSNNADWFRKLLTAAETYSNSFNTQLILLRRVEYFPLLTGWKAHLNAFEMMQTSLRLAAFLTSAV